MTMLDHYWPTLANIDRCIRTEAETANDAVLLAVHEPGALRVRTANAATEEMRTEKDLLDALLQPADDGSAVIVAITGDSGVGKSHTVRWLYAKLQCHSERDRLVIVLVPKTASLRQVVERILEPLTGGEYEQLKADLSKAIETLAPGAASQMLATALAIELDSKQQDGLQALKASGNTSDRQARERIALARGLRDVLRDPAVFDKWFGNVLKRIVKQTIEGGSEADTGELRRFTPKDLEVPGDWDASLCTDAANQCLRRLESNEGAARTLAAEVLQDVLDPALRAVFRFSEALGQRTIEEIVDDIRRTLLADGKELVLLIEDFAALAGIQQPLLNLMIAESDHQGERVRAPLRTALAVTDGFLPSRQTILTRAKREWIIPNTAKTEEEVIQRLTNLAGRYLNAARWGEDALREQYAENAGIDLYGWVKPYKDPLSAEEEDILTAFGKSQHGYPLFPLSREAVESLCRRELRVGNQLIFNPRAFINAVLRDTLLKRPLHEQGAFPPAGFKEAVLGADAELGLRAQALPQHVKDRLAPVLVHWAGNPPDLGAPPRVSKGIFDAFNLPWPFRSGVQVPPAPKPEPHPTVPPKPPQPGAPRPGTPGLDELVEAWAMGSLAQVPAREIRKLLATALNERMDWNGLRMRANSVVEAAHIWLPFAIVGNPTTEPKFVAGEELRPLSLSLRAGVKAIDRWNYNGRSWNYPGAEDDYAMAQQLLDRLEDQAIGWFAKVAQRQAAVAVRILHRQALMLRLTQRAEPTTPRLVEYFAPLVAVPTPPEAGDRSHSAMVIGACVRAATALPQVQRLVLDAIGCFQGIGSLPHALDTHRLSKAWKSEESEDDAQQLKPELREVREAAIELGRVRVEVLLNRYRSVIDDVVPKIKCIVGAEPDIGLVAPMRDLIGSARKAGLFPSDNFVQAQIDRALELLATDEAKSVIRRAVSFTEPNSNRSVEFRLAAWAAINIQVLVRVGEDLVLLDRLAQAIHREARAALQASGAGDVAAMVAKLQNDLLSIVSEARA